MKKNKKIPNSRQEVLEAAYKKLKKAITIKEDPMFDGSGWYSDYSIKWDKSKVLNILEDLLEELQ